MALSLGFLFPGQGSQHLGMLSELAQQYPLVHTTFEEASEALGYDLWQIIADGSTEQLALTNITQPAILTCSVAIWRIWKSRSGPLPQLMAGHSLGEYSALVCADVLQLSDAVSLVKQRGELMQNAVPVGTGCMAAIMGLDDHSVVKACADASKSGEVSAVNFNAPGQVVIAGHNAAVARAIELCKSAGAKRALPLPVSAPFHSSLMRPAAEQFSKILSGIRLQAPKIPVIQNFGLETTSDIEKIRINLVQQIYNPVPWVATINQFVTRNILTVIEMGPGKVLSTLNKRIQVDMTAIAVNDPNSLDAALLAVSV